MCLLIISDSSDSGVICKMPEGLRSSLRFWDCAASPCQRVTWIPASLTQLAQPAELIVDERLQRCNIQDAHAVRRIFIQQGQDGKEGRLGLAGSGGCR